MSYKGLIIKIQKLKAYYDKTIFELEDKKEENEKIVAYKNFSQDLDSILESEKYAMKRQFKY